MDYVSRFLFPNQSFFGAGKPNIENYKMRSLMICTPYPKLLG